MLVLWSANIEKGRDLEYKELITKNMDIYRKHGPPGWTLKGVYGSAMNIGRYDVTWIWECKKFADLDVMRDHNDPVLDKACIDEADFYVPGSFNTTILREVGDWSVLPPKKKEKGK